MSSNPSSHFITLPDRPIVQDNGQTTLGPLRLHYWEWKGHQPTILFCHAASFHGRCYDRVINEALSGHHVIALDFRGHGRSQQHPPPYRFRWLGEDVLYFIEAMNLCKATLIGIGHSAGGYALTYAAAIAPQRLFQYLLLFDPGIVSRALYGPGEQRHESLEYILRRKNQWSSVEEMITRLQTREPFVRWPTDILRNYCTYALDETCKLRCSSEGEHSMYRSSMQIDSDIYSLIERSPYIGEIPIQIVRSSLPHNIGQFDTSPTAPDLVRWFKKGREMYLDNVTHLFPMEKPQVMVDTIKSLMQTQLRSQL